MAMVHARYVTQGGVQVDRTSETLRPQGAIEPVLQALDSHLGVLLSSGYEVPGRYTRWDIGFFDPPVQLVSRDRHFELIALNERGQMLLAHIHGVVASVDAVAAASLEPEKIVGRLREPGGRFPEEQRSKQPSIFSVLRALVRFFGSPEDKHLGFYGAFGYDLAFQFEPIAFRQERPADRRDLVLYLPDEIVVIDHRKETAARLRYDFTVAGDTTSDLPRIGRVAPYRAGRAPSVRRDHRAGEYADVVRVAHEWFRRGDLFEVVPGQSFFEACTAPPSEVFRRVVERNPAPYSAFMNLGEDEYLVGASPEMYIRSSGRKIETCPISGTIARGADPIADAEQIQKLLSSEKEKAELTMCTDVDRNDKARVCEPESVKVIGRRQIELYSRVIHTVDHVEGILRPEFDALDAFLSHAWAVTVTGAPKLWAMRFIEQHERSYRAWYGGALGLVGFDGNINTGLTLRTIRIKHGVAEVRAGGTLLIDADPAAEERETEMKASAFIDAIMRPSGVSVAPPPPERVGRGKRVLLFDHEDSFVHTLASYFRQTGADVSTLRVTKSRDERAAALREIRPDLVVLSPGPGAPKDFDVAGSVDLACSVKVPVFGVCLGLQGIVEHFGGTLGVLPYPVHGKPSVIRILGGRLFQGLHGSFVAGRYHSLYAIREALPGVLQLTAETEDGVVMAVEHRTLPVAAVQFHPESIMTLEGGAGYRLIENVVKSLAAPAGSTPTGKETQAA
jgi:anthranilate synthase